MSLPPKNKVKRRHDALANPPLISVPVDYSMQPDDIYAEIIRKQAVQQTEAIVQRSADDTVRAAAQSSRALIKTHLAQLPAQEAAGILAILEEGEKYNHSKKIFRWDDIPAEVRNMIYRCLFVPSKEAVVPRVDFTNTPAKRKMLKHNIGGHFLRVCKRIYEEGNAVLRK